MLDPNAPALVLAPMEGVTDAPMCAFMGAAGAFTYAVSEFLRVSVDPLPPKVFVREVPELLGGGLTPTGLPVQVQILGGDPDKMALSAQAAVEAGAWGIDVNFGCPAPTVNRHDGGASLLRHPQRIREIVAAIRAAVPAHVPVSAKIRLGWDCVDDVDENAAMAAEGGASWITVHARTRTQGYLPPVFWPNIGRVRKNLNIPVVANGDIWTLDDFRRCRDETGCRHFMIGRGALARPSLAREVAHELGIGPAPAPEPWDATLRRWVALNEAYERSKPGGTVARLKQWLKLAHKHGDFRHFDAVKRSTRTEELFDLLAEAEASAAARR